MVRESGKARRRHRGLTSSRQSATLLDRLEVVARRDLTGQVRRERPSLGVSLVISRVVLAASLIDIGQAAAGGDYPGLMTREEAIAEVDRRRAVDPDASWIASQRDGEWIVVRIGVAPTKVTGTATKPPPVAPQGDPHSAVERAAWFAGGGG